MTRKEQNDKKPSKYSSIMKAIFVDQYSPGDERVSFTREHIIEYANKLGITVPKNLGDVVYSFRYRAELPDEIQKTAPAGKKWIIVGEGAASYCFKLSKESNIEPNPIMEVIPIPDNTPEAICMYQLSDEQSLLCKIRYNRLLDTFLGIVTYSMQNHLRTQVKGIGQIEIDEIYIGVNKKGQHFIIPVEAKIGKDKVGVVQTMQDVQYCKERFPDLICIPIAVHNMEENNTLCIFRLTLDEEEVKIADEKHYKLTYAADFDRSLVAKRNKELSDF